MTPSAEPPSQTGVGGRRLKLFRLSELKEGQTRKFQFLRGQRKREGFAARHQGRIVAYENRCQHLPLPLDYGDNRFFSADERHFVCQAHGAMYDPLSGRCVRGPCGGKSLHRLKAQVEAGWLWLVLEDV